MRCYEQVKGAADMVKGKFGVDTVSVECEAGNSLCTRADLTQSSVSALLTGDPDAAQFS